MSVGENNYSAEVIVGTTRAGDLKLYDVVNLESVDPFDMKDGHRRHRSRPETKDDGQPMPDGEGADATLTDTVAYDDPAVNMQDANPSRRNSVATPSWDVLIARYGAHPQGMEPRGSDVRTPRRIRGSEATSRLVRSILESPQINDDMRAAIQDAVAEGELGTYTPQSNERLLERAQDEIAKGFPNAVGELSAHA